MKLGHIVFWVTSLVFSQPVLAAKYPFDCKTLVETFKSQYPMIDIEAPNKLGIRYASHLYQISPDQAKCVFPNVVVTPDPVGEYESIDDELKTVTLTGRITFTWGNLVMTEAVIKAPTQDVEIDGSNGHYFVTTFETKK
jgi:hypothetical protein